MTTRISGRWRDVVSRGLQRPDQLLAWAELPKEKAFRRRGGVKIVHLPGAVMRDPLRPDYKGPFRLLGKVEGPNGEIIDYKTGKVINREDEVVL